jgi:hypothetical protein
MNDGPIDLIVEAFGRDGEVQTAYEAAAERFVTILDELCAELGFLRCSADKIEGQLHGTVARRMFHATEPYAHRTFITPMAAVAGAVAEEVLSAITAAANLAKAYVNDGGDIALHLALGEQFCIGLVDRPDRPSLFANLTLQESDEVRGIATSGWRGRSFSLGIADAVTVLAETASAADAAATIIANAVDLPGSEKIRRVPARDLVPDSDLGNLPVTQSVEPLTPEEVKRALAAGMKMADNLRSSGLIVAAALHLQGETQTVGADHQFGLDHVSADSRSLAHA